MKDVETTPTYRLTHTPKLVQWGIQATYSGRGCERDRAAESVVRAIVRAASRHVAAARSSLDQMEDMSACRRG